ncbi:MAG TPA: DUF4136 domain-containing protein, partial [Burkholderiaceae bacterium]
MTIPAPVHRLAALAALAGAALLSGCAGLHTVTSTITSYGQWPAGAKPGAYAFDRLPSQQAHPQRQQSLEAAAAQALAGAGFQPAPEGAKATYTVQVGARIEQFESDPWDDPFWAAGMYHWGYPGWHHPPYHGPYWGPRGFWGPGPGPWFPEPDVYEREVALLIRDAATGKPLYEARAMNEGNTAGGDRLLAAMYEASMRDFPNAVQKAHDVTVDLTLAPPAPGAAVPV